VRAFIDLLLAQARRIYAIFSHPRIARPLNVLVQLLPVALVIVLVARNWQDLIHMQWSLSATKLLVAGALYVLIFVLWSLAWLVIVHTTGAGNLTRESRIYAYTVLMRRIPFFAAAWVYLGKPAFYAKEGLSKRHAVALNMLDVATQILGNFVVTLCALSFSDGFRSHFAQFNAVFWLAGAISIAAIGIGLAFNSHTLARLSKLDAPFIARAKRMALIASALYAASWLIAGAVTQLFFNGATAQFTLSFADALAYVSASGLVSYLTAFIPIPKPSTLDLSLAYFASVHFATSIAGIIALAMMVFVSLIEIAVSLIVLALTSKSSASIR
jgi:hypothetical protein